MDRSHYDESNSSNGDIPKQALIEGADHEDSQKLPVVSIANNVQDSNSSVFGAEQQQQPVRLESARVHRASISTQRLEMDAKTLGGQERFPLYVAVTQLGAGKLILSFAVCLTGMLRHNSGNAGMKPIVDRTRYGGFEIPYTLRAIS
jgi:hypothetical protein